MGYGKSAVPYDEASYTLFLLSKHQQQQRNKRAIRKAKRFCASSRLSEI